MKKLLACMLVLTLVVSMSASAFAAPQTGTNRDANAGIEYEDKNGGGEIIDPPGPTDPPIDPPDVPDGKWEDYRVTGLDFGKQEISKNTATHNSVTQAKSPELRYTGVIIENFSTKIAYRVDAKISGFNFTDGAQEATMLGSQLKLTNHTVVTTATNTSTAPTVAADVTLNSDPQQVIFANPNTQQGIGYWGIDWSGDLTVLGGTVLREGEAQAVMTWTVTYPTV